MSEAVRSCDAEKTALDNAEIPCEAASPAIKPNDAPRPHGQPECASHGENCGLIKLATKRGGYRPGAGRKPAIPLHPAYGPRWYCVVTAPHHEPRVIHDLLDMGFDVHGAMVVEDDQLLCHFAYPGYVFVSFDVVQPAWGKIDERPRRRLMVDAAGLPVPVRRGYVEGLLAAAEGSGYIDARPDAVSGLSIGAAVRITDGPLAGFDGSVVCSAGKWIKVAVTVFGRPIRVTLPRSSVEPR